MGLVRVRQLLPLIAALLLLAGLADSAQSSAATKKNKSCRASKKGPIVRTPGYRGKCKAPKTKIAQPLPASPLGGSGRLPDLLVDEAGTAHVVWLSDGNGSPDLVHYCRMKRGANTCDNPASTRTMFPDQPMGPQYNIDNAGAKILAVGDDLVILSYRYPNVVDTPLGTSDSNLYMWISDNGGESFSGPALVGDNDPSGDAEVFGPPDSPRIGTISDTRTGGTFFQAIRPGQYSGTQANLGEDGPDRAYSGSLATLDSRPIAAFADLQDQTFIRQWNGTGDPNDSANWTTNQVPGTEPKIASGGGQAYLTRRAGYHEPFTISRLDGIQPQKAVTVTPEGDIGARDLSVDASGTVHFAWVQRDHGQGSTIRERRSSGGSSFSSPRLLARSSDGSEIGQLKTAATEDGGGFTAFVDGGSSVYSGPVEIAPFGRQQLTGNPGLGGRPGGGASPDTQVSCERVAYGAVEALTQEGCLLSAAGQAAKVSEGPIRLNGLEIIPDAGVKILLGTREKTIDTTGRVTVQIANGSDPIVLFHGELHIRLPSGADGTKLVSFDSSKFPVDLSGFPVQGDIDVILRKDSVEIPISLKLPGFFGGLTGNAVLKASNDAGLEVSSMRFQVGALTLGPVVLKDLDISWNSGSNWSGSGTVIVGSVTIEASIEFRDGAFNRGFVKVTPVKFPGVVLFTDVYLNSVSGDLQLDPLVISAGATFGFQPIAPDLYLVGLDSKLTVLTKPAFAVELTGDGSLAGIPISESKVHGDADGYFSYYSKGEIDLGIITASNEISGFFNARQGLFSASVGYDGCVGEDPFVICSGFQGLVSSEGIGGCALGRVGFRMHWGESPKLIGPFSCDVSDYKLMSSPLADATASAGERVVSIPSGLRGASLRIAGEGGPPSVVLISPSGERLTPVPPTEGSDAPVTQVNGENEALIGLASPEGGSWTIEPQPGPAIASVEFARSLAPPTAKAKVKRGKGRKRTLTYRATTRPGLKTVFFERVGQGISLIGSTTKAKGKISFRAADGAAGKRAVFARIDEDGLPRLQKKVASYRAPGPIRPPRPRGLKASRKKAKVTIRWRKSAGASDYLVRIKVSDGRNLQFLTSRTKLREGQMRKGDRVKISVVGRSRAGRAGKAARITKKVR